MYYIIIADNFINLFIHSYKWSQFAYSIGNSNLDALFCSWESITLSETNCEDQEIKECEHAGSIIQLKHD